MKQAYPAVANALEIISDDNNYNLEPITRTNQGNSAPTRYSATPWDTTISLVGSKYYWWVSLLINNTYFLTRMINNKPIAAVGIVFHEHWRYYRAIITSICCRAMYHKNTSFYVKYQESLWNKHIQQLLMHYKSPAKTIIITWNQEFEPIRGILHHQVAQKHTEAPQYPWWEANITDEYRYSWITYTLQPG